LLMPPSSFAPSFSDAPFAHAAVCGWRRQPMRRVGPFAQPPSAHAVVNRCAVYAGCRLPSRRLLSRLPPRRLHRASFADAAHLSVRRIGRRLLLRDDVDRRAVLCARSTASSGLSTTNLFGDVGRLSRSFEAGRGFAGQACGRGVWCRRLFQRSTRISLAIVRRSSGLFLRSRQRVNSARTRRLTLTSACASAALQTASPKSGFARAALR